MAKQKKIEEKDAQAVGAATAAKKEEVEQPETAPQEVAEKATAEKAATEKAEAAKKEEVAEKAAAEKAATEKAEATEKATGKGPTPKAGSKTPLEKAGEQILSDYPAEPKVYMTSNGFGFFRESDARNHAATLQDKTITTVKRK